MDRQTHIKRAACVACWLTTWLQCQIYAGEDAATVVSAPPKTVVLKDGGILVGEVSRDGDRYLIARAGGEIQVAPTNVLFVCESLEEAYELRRAKTERRDAASHLLLADWCLRYNLASQAARELADVRELEPLHPRLALLELRLAALRNARTQSVRPANSTQVNAATIKTATAPSRVTTRIDELPDGAVERFTRKVQPILVNNCTTSGCHRTGGPQEFQLDRSLLHGMGNRRTTMQNLAATLALIDRAQPHLSPLLTVPRETHGGMDGPIFGPRQQVAFANIVEWVAMVGNSAAADQEANSLTPEVKLADVETTMATVAEANPSDSNAVPLSPEADDLQAKPQNILYGAQLEIWQPKDPFDPEIFNRAGRSRLEKNKELPLHEVMPANRSE